jgi:hypothetical protein
MRVDPDEKFGADLLRPLAAVPRSASRVDITRAIDDGERRLSRARWVRSSTAGMAVALILVGGWALARPALRSAPPTPAASPSAASPSASPSASASTGPRTPVPPTTCALHRLPVPAGQPAKSLVTGADPTGRYILGRTYPAGPRVVIWHDGQVRKVAMTGSDPELNDVTSTGVAVGTSFVGGSSDKTSAWVYRNGRISRLPGGNAAAYGINERQVIVGSVNGRPALWRTPTSQPTMLATPGRGWAGWAVGIDEDGTVVGRLQSAPDKPEYGYLWRPNGRLEKLAVPTLRGKAVTTYTADSIRNGWVVGWARLDEGDIGYLGAPLWNLHTGAVDMSDERLLATAVNRYGWTVGDNRLVIGGTVSLPDFGENPLPGGSTHAYSISDDGATVAGQVDLHGQPVAVVWKCQ